MRAVTLLLLQHGADTQAVDAEKRTALFYAARAQSGRKPRALQQAGAALDVQDSRRYNALDDALAVEPPSRRHGAALAGGACHSGHPPARATERQV